jgi:WD40 repeat protein
MNPDPKRVEAIFSAALEKPSPEERSALLDESCAGDAALRQRVEALLKAHQEANSFLQGPLPAVDATPTGPASADAPTVGLEESATSVLGTKVRYVGDYELLELIARGGMGVVYRARQVSLNRIVAVKMIIAGQLASAADVQRFKTEAEAAAGLDHPHIVPIYEVGEYEGQHYFSMKLVEGRSLAQSIAERPGARGRNAKWQTSVSEQRESARLIAAVARAVHHAHQRGVLHRDLKPANILLQAPTSQSEIRNPKSEIPMVTDFGVAKRVESESGMTQTGAIVGTPSYMAPEQARAEKELTTAVDVYSLGAVLYELLTGRPPFQGATTLDTLLQAQEKEPTPPRALNSRIDRDLETICLKCLRKEPARRYGSAEALAEDLERWLRGEPIQARPVRAPERAWRWCRRNPAVAATTALAVLALVAVGVIAVVAEVREGEHAALIAQQERDAERRESEHAVSIARQERDSQQREREKDRERLRDSFIEQARAERLAGNRFRSLDALRKAADIRRDDELRFDAIATFTRPGMRALPEEIAYSPGGITYYHGVSTWPKLSPDVKSMAGVNGIGSDGPLLPRVNGLQVLEMPSGKPLATRSGSYLPIAFRPGTRQLALARLPSAKDPAYWVSLWDSSTDKEVGKYAGRSAAFSTDGSHLLTIEIDQATLQKTTFRVWNLNDGHELKAPSQGTFQAFLSGHEALLIDAARMPGGIWIPPDECRYRIWDCRAQQERFVTPDGLKPVGYSAPAQLAVLRGRLKDEPAEALHVWDLAAGKRVGVIAGLSALPKAAFIRPDGGYLVYDTVNISPNGHYLVFADPGSPGESLRVWDLRAGQFSSRLTAPRGLKFIAHGPLGSFSPDGTLLASLMVADVLCVWDTASGIILATIPGVSDHWWSEDGKRLIVLVARRSPNGFIEHTHIGFWDVTPPLPSYEIGRPVKSLSLNKDGSRLAVNDQICDVVQRQHGQELVSWTTPAKGITPQFVGTDEVWVAGTREGTAQMPTLQGTDQQYFGGKPGPTELWQLEPKRRMLGVPDVPSPEAQKFADESTNNWAKTYPATSLVVAAASTVGLLGSPWGQGPHLAASALFPGRIAEYRVINHTQGWAIAPNGRLFFRKVGFTTKLFVWNVGGVHVTGAPGEVLDLWNYEEGKRLALSEEFALDLDAKQWGIFNAEVDCFQFSPDGRRFATDNKTGSYRIAKAGPGLRIWNAATGKVEKTLPTQGSNDVEFSRDGRRLLAVKFDGTTKLFDVESSRELQTWNSGRADWQAFALNPDATMVASGGANKMIHLWDVATGRELARWPAHDGGVSALLFSHDGLTVYSGSQDGVLKLWNLPFIRKELKEMGLDW